jgi:hypothetical protein
MLELKNQDVCVVKLNAKKETVLNGKPELAGIMASLKAVALTDVKAEACGKAASAFLKFYASFEASHKGEAASASFDIKKVVLGKGGIIRWYQDKIVIADLAYLKVKAEASLKLAGIMEGFNKVESGIKETVRSNQPTTEGEATDVIPEALPEALINTL